VERTDPDLLPVSRPNLDDFREKSDVFSGVAAFRPVRATLRIGDEPESLQAEMVSATFFDVLGVRPAVGRGFRPEDDQPGSQGVVLGHRLWSRRFGSDPGIVGRAVTLNGHGFTVVGVAPRDFQGLVVVGAPELWVPLGAADRVLFGPILRRVDSRQSLLFSAVARLRPGVSREQAKAALAALARNLEKEYPDANEGLGVTLLPLAQATLPPNSRSKYVLAAAVLLAMSALLFLIACVNIMNLILARSLARRREVAVRLALGAGRSTLARQLAVESLLLSLLGSAAGLALAWLTSRLLWTLRPSFLTDKFQPTLLDPRVLGFALLLALATGLAFALIPLLQTVGTALVAALRERGSEGEGQLRPRLRDGLVLGQIALSLVALVGTGLFLTSLRNAQRIDPGFDRERLALFSIDLGAQGYEPARIRQLFQRIVERAAGVPGAAAVALCERSPFDRGGLRRTLLLEGGMPPGTEKINVATNAVTESYFSTFGLPIVQGRAFTAQDRADSPPVAVINQTLAGRYWPGQDPIGRRFRFSTEPDAAPFEVVGVARDADYVALGEERQPYLYLPFAQQEPQAATLLVRSQGDPAGVVPAVRRELRAADPTMPVLRAALISDLLAESLWAPRIGASLFAVFGVLSLAVSALGIYGVTAYTVNLRRRELGIRIALGATRPNVLRLVLRRTALQLGGGLALGGLIAAGASPLASSLLFGVGPVDVLSYAAAALILSAVAFAASIVPARRATTVDPRVVFVAE
jgi:putative ABC transport system permease protein